MDNRNITTNAVDENILHIVYSNTTPTENRNSFIEQPNKSNYKNNCGCVISVEGCENGISFSKQKKVLLTQTEMQLTQKPITRYMVDGDNAKVVTKKTVDGERSFVENAKLTTIAEAYEGKLVFKLDDDECIYGLGQDENGIINHRGTEEYLYQNNMKIPMPILLSSKNYAICFDCSCFLSYKQEGGDMEITLDAVDQISYYFISGDSFDELVRRIRHLTGKAVMLPQWAFGYIQSKERYKSSEEILQVADEFKKRKIPLSCLVQDWLYWENGKWGNKRVDKSRYPDLKGMLDTLHKDDIAFMISLWPNINKKGEDYTAFLDSNKLLCNLSTYDAFDEEAREIYWKQCESELFSAGVDAWWCDSTEPFTPDWGGAEKKSDAERFSLAKQSTNQYIDARQSNAFALIHAKGMYENQRAVNSEKRVTNLTRSGWPSIQKYGAILWSGDITATWETLQKQIVEGLNICMTGIPYWTIDIGGFFTVKDKWENRGCGSDGKPNPLWFWNGDFNDGVNDMGYRELYTRWLQYATFLPIMRSHGTDTPREPWQFGEKGSVFYDTIVKYIKLRYKLMPYIYSLAAMVTREDYTMLRSLMFDFAGDRAVAKIDNQYMFGSAFMVCPITSPMLYEKDSEPLTNIKMQREVYLPNQSGWYNYETKEYMQGGQTIMAAAPIESMPLFVREGAIIPNLTEGIYEIEIYGGASGSFKLYFDNGNDYSYEKGNYAQIELSYDDKSSELTFGKVVGEHDYPIHYKVKLFTENGKEKLCELDYMGCELTAVIA